MRHLEMFGPVELQEMKKLFERLTDYGNHNYPKRKLEILRAFNASRRDHDCVEILINVLDANGNVDTSADVVYYDGCVMKPADYDQLMDELATGKDKKYIQVDNLIYRRFYPDSEDLSYGSIQEGLGEYNFYVDMASILSDTLFDLSAARKDIELACDANGVKFDYYKIAAEVTTRRNFAEALKEYKDGSDVATTCHYRLSDRDLHNLAVLHKKNKFRKKIEALLESANYHTACGDFANRQYDTYLKDRLTYEPMIAMTIYCDSTDLYTEDEIEVENLTSLDFPKVLVNAYCLSENLLDTMSFNVWLDDYTADATQGLYDFAKEHGFMAKR